MNSPVKLKLDLEKQNVGHTLGPGCRGNGSLALNHGALIAGEWVGDLVCAGNSAIIIQQGARVQGRLEAARIYVAGQVLSPDNGPKSLLIGRQLIAASPSAEINADLYAPSIALSRCKTRGHMGTLEDLREIHASGRLASRTPAAPKPQIPAPPPVAAPARREPPAPARQMEKGFFRRFAFWL